MSPDDTIHPISFDRRMFPLIEPERHDAPAKASQLVTERCDVAFARSGVAAWHSRLPATQEGPWMLAFAAHYRGTAFAVALWNNPSARTLPGDWLELRRMAVAPDAPHCTASAMLGSMRRWISANRPDCPRLISYQDLDVHKGTIYRAAGWERGPTAKPRVRDRTILKVGTDCLYRSSLNGCAPDSAGKVRWEVKP